MILFGASGHAKVIIDILEKNQISIDYLIDANPSIKELMGYRVVLEESEVLSQDAEAIISIGSNKVRKSIASRLNVPFGVAVHPSVQLGKEVVLGEGTVVMAGAIINSATNVGAHVIVNTSASVDHDCIIGDYAHVSPNATLCGGVEVGEGTWVGAGAVVIPGIKIGKWAVIGAGAVVVKDVPDSVTVVGNPGKNLENNG